MNVTDMKRVQGERSRRKGNSTTRLSGLPSWRVLSVLGSRLRFESGNGRSSARLGVRSISAQHPGVVRRLHRKVLFVLLPSWRWREQSPTTSPCHTNIAPSGCLYLVVLISVLPPSVCWLAQRHCSGTAVARPPFIFDPPRLLFSAIAFFFWQSGVELLLPEPGCCTVIVLVVLALWP